jgi:glycosyltransferase involved in cell wall biosynthesis
MGYAVHRADRILAISEYSRSRALAYFGLAPARIDVVHLGVDHASFPISRDPRPQSEQPYFFCLGNSRPYKNIATALRAFALCARERPDVTLVVTGRGDSTPELQRLARRLGIDGRVTFTGWVDHDALLKLLHGALALVFPSVVEGFGLPVLEAMAAGCPVLASNCPTLTEIAGSAALFCDPSRPEDFAREMLRLASEPALGLELRHRGIERAAGFTWRRTAERTLDVYQSLLESTAGSRAVAG